MLTIYLMYPYFHSGQILEDESLRGREKCVNVSNARCNIHYDGAGFMLCNVVLSYIDLSFVLL